MAKRANGDGTISKRTVTRNGKPYTFWEGRVTVGYDPGSAHKKRPSAFGRFAERYGRKPW